MLCRHQPFDPRYQCISRFVKAEELVNAGCMNASDLHLPQFFSRLTNSQQIGVKYLEHLGQPVLRQEAETITVSFLIQLTSFPDCEFYQQFIRDNISSRFEVILTGS